MRLDMFITEQGISKSRTAAQELIKKGGISVNGRAVTKCSAEVTQADKVELIGELPRYVGRGGLKLEAALASFSISLDGLCCADIGASTGGFTDCMLQNGASVVYAIDVGSDQLDEKLRADSRVISMEKTDIRSAELPEQVDFIGTDVSFISLKLILPHIMRLLKAGGMAAALIKPQFEAGRCALNKQGVVRDEKVRKRVVEDIRGFAADCGFSVIGVIKSPIEGGSGNVEYLMCLKKPSEVV
ncbi:MAG: TlyA family RNA methyltransferase [Oscillospiraceae bacterium]